MKVVKINSQDLMETKVDFDMQFKFNFSLLQFFFLDIANRYNGFFLACCETRNDGTRNGKPGTDLRNCLIEGNIWLMINHNKPTDTL